MIADFSRDLFRHSGDRLSSHPPSLILSLPIVIKKRLLRIRLGGKPLFGRAFRNAVKSQNLSGVGFLDFRKFMLSRRPKERHLKIIKFRRKTTKGYW